jgi:flagellar basal-body rod protein FlgC
VDFFRAVEISAAGLAAQQARVEAATLNIANMNTSIAPGTEGFRPLTAVIHSAPRRFAAMLGDAGQPDIAGVDDLMLAKAELVVQAGATTRTVYEPGHPDADANGMVAYPAVDHTQEMMTVMTALRAYEANLAALQVTKTLASRALEIGG